MPLLLATTLYSAVLIAEVVMPVAVVQRQKPMSDFEMSVARLLQMAVAGLLLSLL